MEKKTLDRSERTKCETCQRESPKAVSSSPGSRLGPQREAAALTRLLVSLQRGVGVWVTWRCGMDSGLCRFR